MKRARNAVVIIILCIIGAMSFKKKAPQLTMPEPEQMKDAVAGNPVRASSKKKAPKLTLASNEDEHLRDALAGNAVGTPPNGNSTEDVPPPPRGSGEGGFGPQGNGNPGQNIVPPPPVSPSGPETETPPSEQYYD